MDGFNWYAYCGNDPVNFVDPWGFIPTAKEAALMSKHIYTATQKNYNQSLGEDFGGWQLIDIRGDEGLKIGVYSRTVNGVTEYCLVNKGTSTGDDWVDNLQQPFGWSTDMENSIKESKDFVASHSSYEITMVGHSKGGAEAVANAIASNKNCIVFNPATTFLESYNLSVDGYSGDMYVYVIKGEPVTTLESSFSKPVDKYIELDPPEKRPERKFWQLKEKYQDQKYLHSIDTIITALSKK